MKNAQYAESAFYYALRIAQGFQKNVRGFHVERSDLESIAMLGLVYAAQKFEPSKGVAFRYWANIRIRGVLIDYLGSDNVKAKKTALHEDIADNVQQSVESLAVLEAINHLPIRLRTLIRLRFYEGWTHPEVAKLFKLTSFRTNQLQSQALKRLKAELQKRGIRSVQDVL